MGTMGYSYTVFIFVLFVVLEKTSSSFIASPDWQVVVRDVFIDFDSSRYLLTVHTPNEYGVEAHTALSFYAFDDTFVGDIDWNFKDWTYLIRFCETTWTQAFTNVPMDTSHRYWRIARTDTALYVFCNEVEVLKYVYADSALPDCSAQWNLDAQKFKFYLWDTASTKFMDTSVIHPVSKEIKKGTESVLTCKVEAITSKTPIRWTATPDPNGPFVTSDANYVIDDPDFDEDTFSITYTLTVRSAATAADSTYYCYAIGALDGAVIAQNSVHLHVYEVDAVDKWYGTVRDAVMECHITGVTTAASVTWEDSDGEDVEDDSGYTVAQGSADNAGEQISTLTISPSVLLTFGATKVFTCVVRSGEFPDDSPDVKDTLTMTKLTFDVAVTDKEEKEHHDSTITCRINGISESVTVTWASTANGDGLTGDNYVVEGDDSFSSSSHYQLSMLTVKAEVNVEDSVYYCQITSWEWDKTKEAHAVVLNVFEIHNEDTYHVATATNAALYCHIHGITETADVYWDDEDGNDVAETEGYTFVPGVAYNDNQLSIVTLTPSSMAALGDTTTFTCVVLSSEYEEYSDEVEATIVMHKLVYGVTSISKEVAKGTEATIACQIDGIPYAVTVVWSATEGSGDLSGDTGSYIVDEGCYNHDSHSQTSHLTVKAGANTGDTTYYCRVTSWEWDLTDDEYEVHLKVFEVSAANKFTTKHHIDVVLTCSITGVNTATTVTWMDHHHHPVLEDASFKVSQGSVSNRVQESTLTIAHYEVEKMSDASTFTCMVKSGEYAANSPLVVDTLTMLRPQEGFTIGIVVLTVFCCVFLAVIILLLCILLCIKCKCHKRYSRRRRDTDTETDVHHKHHHDGRDSGGLKIVNPHFEDNAEHGEKEV